jgi:hypothetical protein
VAQSMSRPPKKQAPELAAPGKQYRWAIYHITGTPAMFAEFETNLRRERQLEGIAKAKAAGVYKGRPASIDAAQVRAMKAQGSGGVGDREGAQDRAGVGLSSPGSRLIAAAGKARLWSRSNLMTLLLKSDGRQRCLAPVPQFVGRLEG